MKKVTILLCTPDMQSDITRRCLDSLFKNTYSRLYKLVVSDNKWDSKFSHPHEMNRCLKTLDTEYMANLDDDVVLTPGWLEALLEAAESDPSAAVIGCVHTYAGGGINHTGGKLSLIDGLMRPTVSTTPISSVVYTTWVCSACMLLRKTNVLFDETYAKYRFEIDYCYKLLEKGFRVAVSPHRVQHLLKQQMLQKFAHDTTKVREVYNIDEVVFSKIWYETGRQEEIYKKFHAKPAHPDLKNGYLPPVQPPASEVVRLPEEVLLSELVRSRIKALQTSGRPVKIAVFGAGKHTKWLEKVLVKDDGFPKIVTVLDDKPENGMSILGCKPARADKFDPKKVSAIILSSDCWQKDMAKRCRKLYGAKIKLIDLYEGLPPGPYNKS